MTRAIKNRSPERRTSCGTCGDHAVPARVQKVDGTSGTVADWLGNQIVVALDFVPGTKPGDLVLVHAGVAIGRLRDAS